MTKLLEKQIEERVCNYAKEKGWLTLKFTSPARAAVPDRRLISPRGKIMFVEFKREGKLPTPAQLREHDRLRRQMCLVYVIDDVDIGKAMVDAFV